MSQIVPKTRVFSWIEMAKPKPDSIIDETFSEDQMGHPLLHKMKFMDSKENYCHGKAGDIHIAATDISFQNVSLN
jgi:hypothetical protein